MSKSTITRRKFLTTVGQGALAAAMISPLAGISVQAKDKPMDPITMDLTKTEYAALMQTGGAIKIPNPHDKKKPIIVSRVSETEVAAFSSKCTHFGCEVSLPVNNIIECPCHKAHFDGAGKVTKGPAKKDLRRFETVVNGTTVVISDAPEKK